jgi:hypothetical protein
VRRDAPAFSVRGGIIKTEAQRRFLWALVENTRLVHQVWEDLDRFIRTIKTPDGGLPG